MAPAVASGSSLGTKKNPIVISSSEEEDDFEEEVVEATSDEEDDSSSMTSNEPDGETLGSEDTQESFYDAQASPSPSNPSAPLARSGPVPSNDDEFVNPASFSTSSHDLQIRSRAQGGRKNAYMVVLNNYTQEEMEHYLNIGRNLGSHGLQYVIIGREQGASGTPHLQCVFYFNNQRMFNSVRQLLSDRGRLRFPHIEPCRNTFRSIDYCKKEDDFTQFGVPPMDPVAARKKGGEAEKARWKRVRQLANEGNFEEIEDKLYVTQVGNIHKVHMHFRNSLPLPDSALIQAEFFYGPTGCGKSWYAREAFREGGIYPKTPEKWWDNYDREDTVLIDDIDPATAQLLVRDIKVWADHYRFNAPIKGGMINIRPRRIVITSNYTFAELFTKPQDLAPLQRRFNIWRFSPEPFMVGEQHAEQIRHPETGGVIGYRCMETSARGANAAFIMAPQPQPPAPHAIERTETADTMVLEDLADFVCAQAEQEEEEEEE